MTAFFFRGIFLYNELKYTSFTDKDVLLGLKMINPKFAFRFFCLIGIVSIVALIGCSSSIIGQKQFAANSSSSLHVTTYDGSQFVFPENNWRLTFSGITGKVMSGTDELPDHLRDTTISYIQIAAADSRGEDPWTQLLLTILGVLIVIGISGLILYAAFRATER